MAIFQLSPRTSKYYQSSVLLRAHGLHHVYPCQSTEEIFMLSYKLKDLFIVINYKVYINIIVLKMNANTFIIFT